jgi:hypothetical protein
LTTAINETLDSKFLGTYRIKFKNMEKTAENATGFEILFYKGSYNILLEHCCSTTIFLRGHIDGV